MASSNTNTAAAVTTTATTAAKPARATDAWPPSLTKYVTMSFNKCKSDQDRSLMEVALKTVISKASTEGWLQTHDWATMALPLIGNETESDAPISVVQVKNNPTVTTTTTDSTNGKDTQLTPKTAETKRKSRFQDSSDAEYLVLPQKKPTTEQNTTQNASKNLSLSISAQSQPSVSYSMTVKEWKSVLPPAPITEEEAGMRQLRAQRFQSSTDNNNNDKNNKDQTNSKTNSDTNSTSFSKNLTKREKKEKKRKGRLGALFPPSSASTTATGSSTNPSSGGGGMTDAEMESLRVVGTCTKLEKDYFRLTSAPDPSTVRPEPVLRQALAQLKAKWESDQVEYAYMCNQLKALRQDLTVQHIQNGTVLSYRWILILS